MTCALAFQELTLGYDRHPAVHRLDGEIAEGSLTAIVGPNGAGKSTLLKGVVGTLRPLEGSISFGTLTRSDVAYLPQQSDIDRSFPLSVLDLVAMGLWREIGAFGQFRAANLERVADAISAVGLAGFESRPIGTLSGGQMQRVLFARLLLQDAHLVLLDEPFLAVDVNTMADLIGVVHRWHGEGRTVLAVSHDLDTVMHVLFGTVLALDDDALILLCPIASLSVLTLAALFRPLVLECADPQFLRSVSGR